MSVFDYWRANTWLTRAAMILALLSVLALVGTTMGLTATGPFTGIFALHLTAMLLMGILFVRIGQHHRLRHKYPRVPLDAVWVPSWLKLLTVIALLAFVITFFRSFYTYGEGGPVQRGSLYVWAHEGSPDRAMSAEEVRAFDANLLQVFALGWLFFALVVAWAGHVVMSRVRQLRTHTVSPAA